MAIRFVSHQSSFGFSIKTPYLVETGYLELLLLISLFQSTWWKTLKIRWQRRRRGRCVQLILLFWTNDKYVIFYEKCGWSKFVKVKRFTILTWSKCMRWSHFFHTKIFECANTYPFDSVICYISVCEHVGGLLYCLITHHTAVHVAH